jgi:hypothetical protein
VEDLPKEEFLAEDGVQLTNKYIELSGKKRETEADLEMIKEAIYSYALKENLQILRGSDHKLRIKIEQEEAVPPKEEYPEKRSKLEEMIRKMGRWNEVSELDRHALLRKLKSQVWEQKTVEEIKKYLIIREERRIYPSKLRLHDLK